MKITDVKSAVIGECIAVRIVTDKGIDGFSLIEYRHDYQRDLIPFYKKMIVGCDPTDVEDVLRRMRRHAAFKPWGKVFSVIEMALWDIAGKEAGVPVYKLLGGKVRDKVRVYAGGILDPNPPNPHGNTPEARGENILHLNELYGVSIAKTGGFWHGNYYKEHEAYNTYPVKEGGNIYYNGSLLTKPALEYTVDYIERVAKTVDGKVGLAFDVGPGFMPTDIIRLAKAVEHCHLLWLEDSIAGDYTPFTMWQTFRDVTTATTTPIHTGEQIYLRQNFMDLIENRAVDVIGPDPADVGGIKELKWIAEYAELHGILMAPHGVFDGVFGIAALTNCCATMPNNYVAYEFPWINPGYWFDIVDGLPDPLIEGGHVKVWDKPGIGVEFRVNKATEYLSAEDKEFFL